MKRALAIMVALCTIGAVGFSQINIKGSWTAKYCFIGTPALTSTLALTYTVAGFDVTSTTGFGNAGISTQVFGLKGVFGPFIITGSMTFLPTAVPPRYEKSELSTGFDFGGIGIAFLVEHWQVLAGATSPVAPCQTPNATAGYLRYTFTGTIAPVEVRARFVDCCTGTAFQDLRIKLTGIDLCCGIKYNAEINFTKLGFSNLILSGINVPICCGVSFDLTITYGVTSKSVEFKPKFGGLVDGCLTVWGGPLGESPQWTGIQVDGFRIRCTIADCNYLEYVHAFAPASANIPKAIRDKFSAACQENEYIEMGFCGAGCCGGKYEVTLRIMWSTTFPGDRLFGVTRFVGSAKVPLMANFTLNLDFVMPAGCGSTSFCLGWTFTF